MTSRSNEILLLILRMSTLLALTATLVGCRYTTGTLSPQYDNESAPRRYEIRNVPFNWADRTWPDRTLNCIVGTSDGKRLWAVGNAGIIVQSSDGDHWIPAASGTRENLKSIFVANDGKHLWAVGDHGTIVRSADGDHWNAVATSGTKEYLTSISGTSNGEHLWAAGFNGTIVQSVDGDHWNPVAASGTTSATLLSIFATSNGEHLWAVGINGTMVRSVDGDHWTPAPPLSSSYGALNSIFGTRDGKNLWVVGDRGTILRSSDGDHWSRIAFSRTGEDLTSIFGTSDGKRLWTAEAEGTLLQSSNGDHWSLLAPNLFGAHITSIYGTNDGKRFWATERFQSRFVVASEISAAPFIRQATLVGVTDKAYVQIIMSDPAQVSDIAFTAVNDYDYGLRREDTFPIRCVRVNQDAQWHCPLDIPALHPEYKSESTRIPIIHCRFEVRYQGGSGYQGGVDDYDYAVLYYAFSIFDYPRATAMIGIYLVILITPAILYFVRPLWNIALYRGLKLVQIEKIDIPVVGDYLKPALHVLTVIPWFVKRGRTLDSWVLKNQPKVLVSWDRELATQDQNVSDPERAPGEGELYVPLPIRKGNPRDGEQILEPAAHDIRTIVAQRRANIQIIGPGGAGKTTLARKIWRWAFESNGRSGIAPHPIIPVWIDEELDSESRNLPKVVKGRLFAALAKEDVDSVLFTALLEKQRLAIFVDRLSERSVTAQNHIETIYRSNKIGLLIITSRVSHKIDGPLPTLIYPEPLNSATLLGFMIALLRAFLGTNEDGRPFATIREQCALGERLASLIQLRTDLGERDVPLTPLPVRLFVEQAVQLVREGKSLDYLPSSLPEVFLRQIRIVNPENTSLANFIPTDRLLKVAFTLAKISLGADFVPKEFSRSDAIEEIGEPEHNSDPVRRLVLNTVLIEKQGGRESRLRFALDPVAEFLAAVWYGERCGSDRGKWDEIKNRAVIAPGFRVALELVQQAYWPKSRA